MDALLTLKAFVAVACAGNFSAAGRQLGVATSVVTKRIDQLEDHVRARLFTRTTRRVELTETGRQWLARVKSSVSEVDDILTGLRRSGRDLEGHLRVKLPTTLGVLYLAEILGRFQTRYPRVSLDIVLIDGVVNPVEQGFDVAVSVFPTSFPGVLDEPLCPLRRIVCAAPSYLASRFVPNHPRELADLDTLNFLPTGLVWSFTNKDGPTNVEIRPKLGANDSQVLAAACRQGNGVALLPAYVALPALRDGTLVRVLTDYAVPDIWIKALVPASRIDIPRVRGVLAMLRDALAPLPPWEIA